jgi:hypothetical protein
MHTLRQRLWLLLSSPLLALCACADEPPTDGHIETGEARPIEAPDQPQKAGAIDCARQRATGYEAGRAFSIELVHIDGEPVQVDTASAYFAMQEAAARDGVSLYIVSGFRSHAEQQYLYNCYINCACNNCNLAASPGYSNHQSGYALDLNTEGRGVYAWLARHAARFGFRRTVPSEDWHWEYFGGGPKGDLCASDGNGSTGGNPSPTLKFLNMTEGNAYDNGVTLQVEAGPEIHHVRYSADGHPLGAAEDRRDHFALRYLFHELGQRVLRVEGFDAHDRRVATRELKVTLATGAQRRGELRLSSLEEGGWYRNGQWLKVEAEGPIATVRYDVGGYAVGDSDDLAHGAPARVALHTLGWRVFRAIGLDAQGREVARDTRLVRVLPGDDDAPKVVMISPAEGAQVPNGVTLQAVASDGVTQVIYSSEGYEIGRSTDADGSFPWRHTFTRTGPRILTVQALGPQGQTLAQHQLRVTILP